MVNEAPLVTPEVKAREGVETEWWTYPEPVESGAIRRFAEAIMDRNPLYTDADYAAKSRFRGVIAPPTFVIMPPRGGWELIGPTSGFPPVEIPGARRGVNAGNELEIFRPVRVGDTVSQKTRVAEIRERQGRASRLVIVVYETVFKNQKGELLAVSRQSFLRMK